MQVRHPRDLEPPGQPVALLDFRHAVEVQRNLRPVRPLQWIGPGSRRARPGAGGKGRARPHSHVVGGIRLQQQHRQARGRGVHRLAPQLAPPGNVHLVADDLRVVARKEAAHSTTSAPDLPVGTVTVGVPGVPGRGALYLRRTRIDSPSASSGGMVKSSAAHLYVSVQISPTRQTLCTLFSSTQSGVRLLVGSSRE